MTKQISQVRGFVNFRRIDNSGGYKDWWGFAGETINGKTEFVIDIIGRVSNSGQIIGATIGVPRGRRIMLPSNMLVNIPTCGD